MKKMTNTFRETFLQLVAAPGLIMASLGTAVFVGWVYLAAVDKLASLLVHHFPIFRYPIGF